MRNKEWEKSIVSQDISDDDKIACVDVNFDGYQDIIITHPPSGQIQLSSVFIYDNRNAQFRKNEELSKIQCIKIDKTNKLISGTCFSSSNCDKWIEKKTDSDPMENYRSRKPKGHIATQLPATHLATPKPIKMENTQQEN